MTTSIQSISIKDVALSESIPFWQTYFLKWAVKSDSYVLMKYVSYQIRNYTKLPRSKQFNRTLKVLRFAFNKRNWKVIKTIRSKYRDFVNWSHEPESVWLPLALVIGWYGYFIVPDDFLSDIIPLIGFTDDFIGIILFILWMAIDLKENIDQFRKNETRKYIVILVVFSHRI